MTEYKRYEHWDAVNGEKLDYPEGWTPILYREDEPVEVVGVIPFADPASLPTPGEYAFLLEDDNTHFDLYFWRERNERNNKMRRIHLVQYRGIDSEGFPTFSLLSTRGRASWESQTYSTVKEFYTSENAIAWKAIDFPTLPDVK